MPKLILIFLLSCYSLFGQEVKKINDIKEIFSYCPTNKFIVFGECHGVNVESKIRLESIKFHLEQGRTIHVLLEMGKSSEKVCNEYILNEKLDSTLPIVFPKYFMDSLKVLVKKFPNKLYLHGIDVELNLNAYVEELLLAEDLVKDELIKREILSLKIIKNQEFKSPKSRIEFKKKIQKIVKNCSDYIHAVNLKDSSFINLIERGKISFTYADKGLIRGANFRDKYIYDNIQQIIKLFPNDYFYMQIGSNHAYKQTGRSAWKGGLTEMLNNNPNSLVYNQIFSIGQGLVNCKSRRQEGTVTELKNYPLQINKEVIDFFDDKKNNGLSCYVWQPKEFNAFDLYLITVGYEKEEKIMCFTENYLHLIYNN